MFKRVAVKAVVTSAAVAFGFFATGAIADSSALIEKLYEKGVLSDVEYKELSSAAKEAGDPNELTGKWSGGFKWKTADGKNKFQVAGRIQQDFYDYDHDLEEDTFNTRRVYLGVKATIDSLWKLEATFNPNENVLEYGYLNFGPSKAVNVRFGAQKFYSGFEEGTSSRFTDFLERSMADGLQPGKSIGIQIFGEPVKKTLFYALGYYNGAGKNAPESGNNADGKDSMFALAYNAAGLMDTTKDTIAHIGYSASQGTRSTSGSTRIHALDGPSRGDDFFNWIVTTGADDFSRDHNNLSVVLARGPFKFQAENTEVKVDTPGLNEKVEVKYMAFNWMITGEKYAAGYKMTGMNGLKPDSKFTKNGGTGAWEIGVRRGEWDGGNATNQINADIQVVKTTTIGVKWIPTPKVRFMLNHVTTNYDTPVVAASGDEKALMFRSQIDF